MGDKAIKAFFGTPTDVEGTTRFQGLVPKRKKKGKYTRIDEIMDTFGISETSARTLGGGGYSDAQIEQILKERAARKE